MGVGLAGIDVGIALGAGFSALSPQAAANKVATTATIMMTRMNVLSDRVSTDIPSARSLEGLGQGHGGNQHPFKGVFGGLSDAPPRILPNQRSFKVLHPRDELLIAEDERDDFAVLPHPKGDGDVLATDNPVCDALQVHAELLGDFAEGEGCLGRALQVIHGCPLRCWLSKPVASVQSLGRKPSRRSVQIHARFGPGVRLLRGGI